MHRPPRTPRRATGLAALGASLTLAFFVAGAPLVAQGDAATAKGPRNTLRLALPSGFLATELFPRAWSKKARAATGMAGRLAAGLLDRSLGDIGGAEWKNGGLTLHVDRAAVRHARLAAQREAAKLVGVVIGKDTTRQPAVLELPPLLRERRAPAGTPLIVLVHGFGEGAWRLGALATDLRRRDGTRLVATYGYANDAPIDELGVELAGRLAAFTATDDRPIHLVGYSMGGLVCRWAVETPELSHGNVRRLIQVGSPNLGTQMAWLAWTVDTWHLAGDPDLDTVQAVVRDGLGEAGWDMRPGSTLMRMLASKVRNPTISYHNVLGDGGPLPQEVWQRFVGSAQKRMAALGVPASWSEGLRAALTDSFELVAGAGDGIVSVRRGQLAGVDALVLPLDHRQLMAPATGGEQAVFAAIHRWLGGIE